MRKTNQIFIGEEYQIRFGIWLTNKQLIQEHNLLHSTLKLSLNKFAALTPTEYRSLLGFKNTHSKPAIKKTVFTPSEVIIDWRTKGVVNPIQDQGQCGSCWAFSVICPIESVYAILHGTLYKFSEQNPVDCVNTCYGCDGGSFDETYEYILNIQDGYVELEEYYPYIAFDGKCLFDKSKSIKALGGYFEVTPNDEVYLAYCVLTYGPVTTGIDASNWSFQLYTSGIYDEPGCSSGYLDHGVVIVGYGNEDGVNYWIVRNSWGSDWGEQGYIRMSKDKDNQCGIATAAVVAVSA